MRTALLRRLHWTLSFMGEVLFIAGALVLLLSSTLGRPLVLTSLAMMVVGGVALVITDLDAVADLFHFLRLHRRLRWLAEWHAPRKGW